MLYTIIFIKYLLIFGMYAGCGPISYFHKKLPSTKKKQLNINMFYLRVRINCLRGYQTDYQRIRDGDVIWIWILW